MSLSQETLSAVALAAAGVALVALVAVVAVSSRLGRLRRSLGAVPQRGSSAGGEGEHVTELRGSVDALHEALEHAVQRIGLVRFDAFEDMGGHLSFSAALLDARGHGLVLTTINGRTESRIYAKPVEAGVSRFNLSEEEQEAIRRALSGLRR